MKRICDGGSGEGGGGGGGGGARGSVVLSGQPLVTPSLQMLLPSKSKFDPQV